jgi:diaminopropionate ammonia-lyase
MPAMSPTPRRSTLLINHHMAPLPASARPGPEVQAFHRRLPGYEPTPLRDLPSLAAASDVGRVLVKDESQRLGLPAFKVLGASWATYRVLCERLGGEPEWESLDDLAAVVADRLGPLRLVTATDGNHGRAVAHVARLLGMKATVLVPDGTAPARIDALAGEGAEVLVDQGTYDDAVAFAAEMAGSRDLVISDTSWPGYDDPPRWVIDGYSTMFAEVDAQIAALDLPGGVDLVVVPLGVGALGAAAASCLRTGLEPGDGPVIVGVEPQSAACVAAAVAAGHVVEVPGPHRSIMAGMNCGLASIVALPAIRSGFTAFVDVDDDRARAALRVMADAGLDVGETGAAALAGLMAVTQDHRPELPVPPGATVLLLATEGVTDPAGFEQIVGRPPR